MEVFALGLKVKEEGMATVEKATKSLRAQLGGLNASSLFAGLGLAALTKTLIGQADTAQLLTARLRLVTDSHENLIGVQDALRASADATRSSYAATVELYTRVARNTRDLAVSQRELLQFTELTQMAIKTSGASSTEAAAALIQLSQGLAAGVLRGEEFNSVMEQTPGLAKAIADGLGIGVGQLRAMAMQGQLTADTVINAVLRMDNQIRADFATMPKTVGDAFTLLRNNALFAIKDINEALGGAGTTGLSGALSQIATTVIPAISKTVVAFFKGFELLAVDAAIAVQKILGRLRLEAQLAKLAFVEGMTLGLANTTPFVEKARAEYDALVVALEHYREEQYAAIIAGSEQTEGIVRQTAAVRQLAAATREATFAQLGAGGMAATGFSLDSGQFAPLAIGKSKPLLDAVTAEAARLQYDIRQTFTSAIAIGLIDGIAAGFERGFASGRIGEGFKALSGTLLSGLGSAMIDFGKAALMASTFMQRIRDSLANLTPKGAIIASLAMIAAGASLRGAASRAFGGVGGGGGMAVTPMTQFGIPMGNTGPTQLIFGATSATTAAGMTPRQPINVTLIGPNDPTAQRAMQELMRNANQRGSLG